MVQSIRTEPAIWFNAQQRDQARIRFNELKRQIDLRHEMPVVGEIMIRGEECNHGLGRELRNSQQAEEYGGGQCLCFWVVRADDYWKSRSPALDRTARESG